MIFSKGQIYSNSKAIFEILSVDRDRILVKVTKHGSTKSENLPLTAEQLKGMRKLK